MNIYIYTYVCIYTYTYICLHVLVYIYTYEHIYIGDAFQEKLNGIPQQLDTSSNGGQLWGMYIYILQVYLYICVYMYIYMYIYMCIYVYILMGSSGN
jgi:hypothetical protein